jgi:hypothetical protein
MESSWKKTYRYGNIGLDIVLSIVVGFLVGRFIDRRVLDGHGYATVAGTIVGVYMAGRSLYKLSKQAQRDGEAEDAREAEKAEKDAKVEAYKHEADKKDDK